MVIAEMTKATDKKGNGNREWGYLDGKILRCKLGSKADKKADKKEAGASNSSSTFMYITLFIIHEGVRESSEEWDLVMFE